MARKDAPIMHLDAKYPPALTCLTLVIALVSAGCASQAGAAGNSVSSEPGGTLRVTVVEAGGPPLAGGKTPKNPLRNTEVKVTGHGTSSTADTDKSGIATFRLAYGAYSVIVPACGSTTGQKVAVTATREAALTWTCPVP